jgi:ABC-type transport system substrate-binding protein
VLQSRGENRDVLAAALRWNGARGNVGEVALEPEASAAVAADRWQRGDYDVLDGVLAWTGVADEETVVQRSSGVWTWYLGFNTDRTPLDDVRVRLALAHAIDRSGPAESLKATATAAGGLLPPMMPGHSHRVAPTPDPDRAHALLAEAGYPDGHALGEIVLAAIDLWKDTASELAAQFVALGLRTRVVLAASDLELAAAIEEGAHAFLWAWAADFPDPGGGILNPMLRTNPSVYRNEELEELLARGASLRDQDERLRAYRDFERIWIGEQAAVVPLAYGDRLLWRRPWITGLWLNAIADSTFADAVVRRT